jgi:hypothetical protein
MAKIIELTTPIRDHRGLIRQIELREPRFVDFTDIGPPATWISLQGGGFLQENPSALVRWIERLAGIDPLFIEAMSLHDGLVLRAAILALFQAEIPPADETASLPEDEPSLERGLPQ